MKLDKNTKISPFVIARYEHGYETASSLLKEIPPLDPSVYSTWENGNVSYISEGKTFVAFQKICEIFGWTIEGGRNNLSNMYKWKHDDEIKIVKPTYDEWKEMRGHTEMATLDTSETDISKEEAMLNNPLKVWRGKNNLTRSEAAKLCNVDINVYSDCEDGIKKPNGFDLTKILKGSDLHFLDIQKIFRDDTVKTVIENALEASKNPDPITLENDVISVKICDEIDHNKVIEDALNASKKKDVAKNAYPLNFIVDKCGLPAEDWIIEEFNRQMDEKVYASKDADSYIFFKDERYAIRKVYRDGVKADSELLDIIGSAAFTFQNHLEKLKGLAGTVAEKITEAKPTKIDEPKQDPMQKKLANQTVSYLKEEPVLNDSSTPANNSKNITISKHTARGILRKLYGVLDFNEYYKILQEFTKGGLNL